MTGQALTRICTKWNDSDRLSDLIVPKDQEMFAICDGLLGHGEEKVSVIDDFIKGMKRDVELDDDNEKSEIEVDNISLDSGDIDGNHLDDLDESLLKDLSVVRFCIPSMDQLSDTIVMKAIVSGNIVVTADDLKRYEKATTTTEKQGGFTYVNEDDECKEAREDYNRMVKSASSEVTDQSKFADYGRVCAFIYSETKKRAGIKDLDECRTTSIIEKLIDSVEIVKRAALRRF